MRIITFIKRAYFLLVIAYYRWCMRWVLVEYQIYRGKKGDINPATDPSLQDAPQVRQYLMGAYDTYQKYLTRHQKAVSNYAVLCGSKETSYY